MLNVVTNLVSLRDYCRQYPWPRLSQWHHWIYSGSLVAQACVKKIGGRYLVDLTAFESYVAQASLDEPKDNRFTCPK